MNSNIIYSVILADTKNPAIKHIGKSTTLKEANSIRDKRKIQPNQHIWIGKYVNGILKDSY
jgi:hypothetical protein